MGLGATVLIVALIAGVWYFVVRTPSTQVDLRQALRLYQLGQKRGKSGSPLLPPSGVYRYETFGGEQLSFAGIRRSFPAASNMIVTDARCATMKWEPLEQHMEGLVVCPLKDQALGITSSLSYEDIAGIQTSSVIKCPVGTYFVPPDPRPREVWHTTCHSAGQTMRAVGMVVGVSSVNVNGRKVPALHTRLDLIFSGSESGSNPNGYWVSPNGVILRQIETVDVAQKAGPLGSVRYKEQMGIKLKSLTPSR